MNSVRLDGPATATPIGFEAREEMEKAKSENFSVALRILPAAIRRNLEAIYGYARFVDDIGDRFEGDRLAELAWAEAELDRALKGEASDPIFAALGSAARACGFDRRPLVDLIEANRRDQRVKRYATFEELQQYCALSANPVGRLVLSVFGESGDRLVALSDDVCTGLQLVEHLQDVAEDFRAGRIYLPKSDLNSFGIDEDTIARSEPTPAFRRLMAFECRRARVLLGSGVALAAALSSWARLAIAGYVGGGLAQLDAIERRSFDVFSSPVKANKVAVAANTAAVVRGASRWTR